MLRVRVVGGLRVMLDGEPLPPPAGRPARALLGWLATHPGRHARGRVAAALWHDFTDESARANLRTALSAVRDALGAAAPVALLADRQTVGLAGEPEVVVDVAEFAALLEAGRTAEALAGWGAERYLPISTSTGCSGNETASASASTARWPISPPPPPRAAISRTRSAG